ncbi:hypothetical protein IAD21_03675 [Abditibacteriota bacterium]|nr:hypothetical protein IAD21_03675 [Abditibacteriota bacterium]
MPYRTQSSDTSRAVEEKQVEILRRLGPSKRLETMRKLSRGQKQMAWSALQRSFPKMSPRELQVKAVELWFGRELSVQLEQTLKERNRWS